MRKRLLLVLAPLLLLALSRGALAAPLAAASLQVSPAHPVQKGAPAHFILRLNAAGQAISEADARVTLYHGDDHFPVLTLETLITDGKVEWDYAFADTATYKVIVHAAPTDRTAVPFRPFTQELPVLVAPVDPSAGAQALAMGSLLLFALGGFAIGMVSARPKARP